MSWGRDTKEKKPMQTHKSIETLEMMDRRDDETTALITHQTVSRDEGGNRRCVSGQTTISHNINVPKNDKQIRFVNWINPLIQ